MITGTKIDNKKKDILILGKASTQGLEHTLSAEKMYWIYFTCIIMEQIVIYLLIVQKLLNSKQKILRL